MKNNILLLMIYFTAVTLLCACNSQSSNKPALTSTSKDTLRKDTLYSSRSCKAVFDHSLQRYVYTTVDTFPEYPGGINKFIEVLRKEIHYPQQMLTGATITTAFIVEKDGTMTHTLIADSSQFDHPLLNQRLQEVYDQMPLWKPGKCDTQVVAVQFIMPTHIKIESF